jgi:hypothetical protein
MMKQQYLVMMKRQYLVIIIVVALVCLIIGFISGVYFGATSGAPFVAKQSEWSIGIYIGESPFNLISPETIRNPVLTAKDVTDVSAQFVADPFMVKENSTWYMFFEVMNGQTNQGDIGLAISNDGLNWVYQQIALDEPFHLSYPYVFKWDNEYYMIPESCHAYSVRLYKAVDFPTRWSFIRTLLSGDYYFDSSIFRYNDRWWIFTSDRNGILRLYYADDLLGPWTKHPESPIVVGNANIARPGGRVLIFDGRIIRYTQDDDPTYGNQVRAFEVTELTTVSYEEKEVTGSPILKASGNGWNAAGMHNIDPHQLDEERWIACVDGYRVTLVYGFGY